MPSNADEDRKWRKQVAAGITFAVCPPHFKKFARTRWFGKEECMDQIGLFEHVHGMCSSTYVDWVRKVDLLTWSAQAWLGANSRTRWLSLDAKDFTVGVA